jgi:hypothetical protein
MASKHNSHSDDILFLNEISFKTAKSDKLGDFVAQNVNTDLDLCIKKEKVYQVFN